MNPEKLDDYQLYSLVMNQDIDSTIKDAVLEEFSKRTFTQKQLDELDIKLRNANQSDGSLSSWEKILAISFPFFVLIQAIIASRHLKNGAKSKWSAYWNLMALGYFLWLLALLAFLSFKK